MENIFTETFLTIFLSFVVISFLLLNTSNAKNSSEEKKQIYLKLYDIITVLFILLLVVLIAFKGYWHGIIDSIFIWAFFVIATPIPESGLLISLPLKRFFDFKMTYVQLVVSVVALLITFYLYYQHGSIIKSMYIGKLFDLIVKSKNYWIFIVSIVSSVLGSELIDNYIDNVIYSKDIEHLQLKLLSMLFFMILFVLLLKPFTKI